MHDFEVKRYYKEVFRVGEDEWEFDEISKEDYFNNISDNHYITGLNYPEFIDHPNVKHYFSEFQFFLADTVLPGEENDFVTFINNSIENATTEGKAKSILKTILAELKGCSAQLNKLKENRKSKLNEIQSFVIEVYSASYNSAYKSLLKYYSDIYPEIVLPFSTEQGIPKNEPTVETIKQNKHSQIFHSNAFEVWEQLYSDFKIVETSRADVKFCFEIMKQDGLIHETVSQKAFLKWINDVYQIAIGKPQYKNWKKNTKGIVIYNTAKSLYIKQRI